MTAEERIARKIIAAIGDEPDVADVLNALLMVLGHCLSRVHADYRANVAAQLREGVGVAAAIAEHADQRKH